MELCGWVLHGRDVYRRRRRLDHLDAAGGLRRDGRRHVVATAAADVTAAASTDVTAAADVTADVTAVDSAVDSARDANGASLALAPAAIVLDV